MVFEKVLSTINKHSLIKSGDKIVIGISGGPDSVCLLHILSRLKEKLDIELYAAHLNHQIRGIEAQKDAFYVSNLCDEMGITFFIKSINVPEYCEKNGLTIEEGARKLRYEMFDEIRINTKSNKIAIGHNLNDQAETILMRIMRGTGLQGLKGIDYIRDNIIIRPILDIDRRDIEEYCKQYKLNPRIDESNLENIYTRNKIRLDLIPYMKENFNPNLTESIVRMGNSLRSDNDYIENEALNKFKEVSTLSYDGIRININNYKNLHNSIKARVLRYAIKNLLGDTNFIEQKHIDDIIELEGDSKIDKMINLPRGIFVYRKKDYILITNKEIVIEDIEFCYNVPSNGLKKVNEIGLIVQTEVMSIEKYKTSKSDKSCQWFDFNKIKGGVIVRSRKPGDKIKLPGGSKKIKDLFIDLKIPKEHRCRIPIICDQEGILAVANLKHSANYKIDLETKEVLKVSFKRL